MVDSGRNSGLPDFLHHKNLTLKKKSPDTSPPPAPHAQSGGTRIQMRAPRASQGPWSGWGVGGRWVGTGDHKDLTVSERGSCHPLSERAGSRHVKTAPWDLPQSPQAGHDRCASCWDLAQEKNHSAHLSLPWLRSWGGEEIRWRLIW